MAISYRTTRNLGLTTLLLIIFLESIFAYNIMRKSSERLSSIITVDEIKLKSWYDVSEIISETKNSLYDYRYGKTEMVAGTDLLINRVIREVESIRTLATDEDELNNIDEILKTAKTLQQAVYAYEIEVREGYSGGASAKEMEEIAVQTADRIAQLGRDAANYMSNKIKAKNEEILEISIVSRKMLGLVLIVAIIATIVVASIMARVLAKPITNLVNATRLLAAGDLTHRVTIDTTDEIGLLGQSFNDMAEKLMRSQEELRTAKAYTDNIIRSMTNSLVVVNEDATIRSANQATCDLLGYSERELIGKPFAKIFADGYYEDIGLEELISSGFTSNLETTYRTKEGKKIRILFTGSVIFDTKGKFEGIVCVGQDITIQTETMRAGHLASIGELAAGVAHEINNPINSIINFAQILIDEPGRQNNEDHEIISRIIKEGDRVALIVTSLLSFAREGEIRKESIQLHEVAEEVLALIEAQTYKDGINLLVEVPSSLPAVFGNFQQIEQVFLNIINNARYALNKKYPGNDPDKMLVISGTVTDIDGVDAVQIVFHDHGTGIPAHLIDKILNPFFSTKPAGLGTGLGMAISHGIITDHSGKLQIESDEGRFTKVILLLPVHEA